MDQNELPLEPCHLEFHWVRPKRLLSLWYVWRNPYTYVAPTLTLSPNRPKQYSTWSMSPRSCIGCFKNDFQAYDTFGANMHLSCVKFSTSSKQTEMSIHLSLVTLEFKLFYPKWFLIPWYIWPKPCTYLAPTLTPSPNGPKQDSPWPTSHRSSIRCVQNDIRAYGTFSANRAPILCQD
jgi:fatty acid desaturase